MLYNQSKIYCSKKWLEMFIKNVFHHNALKNVLIKLFFECNVLLGHLPNLKCTIYLK